jgi:hypothetical protein
VVPQIYAVEKTGAEESSRGPRHLEYAETLENQRCPAVVPLDNQLEAAFATAGGTSVE